MRRILFIFLLIITNLLQLSSVISVNLTKGFSMKMIHRDSKESPLYLGDHLTRDERLQRLVKQSKSQARYIESQVLLQHNKTLSINPDVARLPVVYEPKMWYMAKVGLGTFLGRPQAFMNYYLMVDSGSDQTWIQCEDATEFFHQDMPLYPWSSSTTFRPIPCNTHPFCMGDRCNADGHCTYIKSYSIGSVTSGVVAEEKFTLGSNTGGTENIILHFGCGLKQRNFGNFIGNNHLDGKPDLIAGILGLGPGEQSFLNLLGNVGEGKFAYCFELFNPNIEGSDTYLRFGADATIGGAGQIIRTTPLIVPNPETSLYYLNLEDISVSNKKVRFPRGTFKLNSQGRGGAAIDSGTPISGMYKDHFDRVADLVKAHFKKLGVEYIGSHKGFDACFRLRGRFDTSNYPSITLHFQRANYIISDYKANFIMISVETICLGIFRRDSNIPAFMLGAMQQANKRILYNVMDLSLSFAEEYCDLGS